MKFNEQHTVENYIIKFIQNELGYEYIKPEEFSKLREFENEYVVVPLIERAVGALNQSASESEIASVVREVKKLDTNEGFLNVMRNGIDLIDAETRRTKNYKIVDFDEPENNHFVVTNQFYFEGDSENIRPDILIFLNGLPIVDIEAKSPTASESVTFENGIDQIKRYERVARKLFFTNCFNISSDGLKTVYGTTYAPKQFFGEWRDEELEQKYSSDPSTPEDSEGKLEMTLCSLLGKARLLDIVANFILFEKTDEQTIKKMARYQQYRAANKIVERVVTKEKRQGLIWHTQGSGKTLTMYFASWKLRFHKALDNPKIFILIDRIDLDDQLYETFLNCGGKNIIHITSRKDLEGKIQSSERGIFVSTMQKFSELGNDIENLDENVIVFSDEAHRGDEGKSGINMRSAFGNAFFFGFTGTPIDNININTFRNYEGEGKRYLDYYSIQQAIDDGATLPVTYEARLSKFSIDEERLDEQFDEIAGGLDDKQKQELVRKYGKKAALVKLPARMEAIARDIVEHYKLYVQPNGFKAQIVCYDREAAAKYKELIDKLVSAEWSEVVYSPGDRNSDADDLKKYNTNKLEREKIIERFKNPDTPLNFLIVCDMLLTGFDAPIEQVMYLDKPLRDHNLLQAIARTNRVYKHKVAGKIIDYYGITRNLYEALNFDEEVVDSAMIDIDRMKERFKQTLDETMKLFEGVNIEDPSMENLRRCLKMFFDDKDKQKYFSEKYAELKNLFEFLSPDPFLKPHVRQFEWITSFYLAFTKEFRSREDMYLLAQYGEKIKKLISESHLVDYEGITKNFRELRINDLYTMERLNKMEDEDKALNLEKMLKQEISVNLDEDPTYQKFSERLSSIRKEFEQNQIDLAERIKLYFKLLEDIKKKGDEAKELGMNLKEYALYIISGEFIEEGEEKDVREFVCEMAGRIDAVLDEGWQDSSKRDVFIKDVKQVLQELILKDFRERVKINDFHKYLNRLVDIIIKKF